MSGNATAATPDPVIALVVARAENGAIGIGGDLPWRLSTDLKQFRKVTLPSIRPTLVFTILMIVIWSSLVFDYVYMLTGGGPANASEVMATYLYQNAFSRFDAGYAASTGFMMSIWVALAVVGFVLLRRRGWEI